MIEWAFVGSRAERVLYGAEALQTEKAPQQASAGSNIVLVWV